MTAAGYDRSFLAADVATPVSDDTSILTLDYTHFSVGLHTGRRLAAWTAVNIDGAALVEVARGDDWHLDDRIPAEQQAGEELYADNDLDRGHLVRRRDPVWGERARAANFDTFAFPNAAPQAAVFNQSRQLWLGLEDYLLGAVEAADTRLSVLTGCVFDDTDQTYRDIQIPRAFWKVAAWMHTDTLHATGYLLDQSPQLDDLGLDLTTARAEQTPLLGAYRTYQVPVVTIADLTGLDLGPLSAADRLDLAAAVAVKWRELSGFDDITW